ncbi:small nuclear ribonucleoprotein E isoform X2 [Hippopotamus amphibius kiboko]|uniref:small nuclear ribonucleoprotein E isoform X2 n=1 Tax=Hippopotamus amphibius kiboko TaxID=575201 RepID=UPI002598B68C|nr:small nuclear ribonucleoprotein E isoform X2 [Hippopotamus amphibius kiboko]
MAYRGQGQKVQKVMVQPINLIFRYLQNRSRIQVWLYEQVNMRIEGCIIGFDEYMNLVLDDAEEIHSKTKSRKQLAGRRKELDWTVSSRGQLSPSRNWKLRGSQQLYQVMSSRLQQFQVRLKVAQELQPILVEGSPGPYRSLEQSARDFYTSKVN